MSSTAIIWDLIGNWFVQCLCAINIVGHIFKATFSFHKITTKILNCLPYILISHFKWLLQWFILLDMNNLVSFSSLLNALETVNQAKINMSSKMGGLPFKLGRYNRVFLEIWAQIPIWAPTLKQWAIGSFSHENTPEELTRTHKS